MHCVRGLNQAQKSSNENWTKTDFQHTLLTAKHYSAIQPIPVTDTIFSEDNTVDYGIWPLPIATSEHNSQRTVWRRARWFSVLEHRTNAIFLYLAWCLARLCRPAAVAYLQPWPALHRHSHTFTYMILDNCIGDMARSPPPKQSICRLLEQFAFLLAH